MKKSEGGLGFRKLYDFNISLLGKQAWKLVMNQDSLISELFKVRYYPDGSFLSAKVGANPSYVWRSTTATQDLLKSGIARRVGNGANMDVRHDLWLPCENNSYIMKR